MKSAELELPSRYYARLVELLHKRGLDTATLLRSAGIAEAALQDPEARLRLSQVEALVTEAIRLTDSPDLGLDVGRAIKVSTHSMVGYAMLTSPSMEYALSLVVRYFGLLLPIFQVRYQPGRESSEVQFLPSYDLSPACRLFHYETVVATAYHEARELLQMAQPQFDLYLGYPPPVHAGRYAELSGVRCHFVGAEHEGLRFVIPASLLQQPLAMANPAALGLAEARCRELVQEAREGQRVAHWVQKLLREAQDHAPTLTEVAQALNVAPRTLDRYLRAEGQRFRHLQKSVLEERAQSLLREGRLGVTQIALQLGYRDASNFTRAFKKASGESPSAFAARCRDTGATDVR